jgi:cysteine desulfurase / selenocysteine lyase
MDTAPSAPAVAAGDAGASRRLDVERLRADFPILQQRVGENPLVYLDNASTTQKPRAVIDAIARFYAEDYANTHRGVYALSERATQAYEAARVKIQRFINAGDDREIIFVRGTTEAINLVAHSVSRLRVQPGDEIVISTMEHHSNLVPWQIACAERGAVLRVAPINDEGELLWDEYERLLTPRTKLVAMAHVSNALGTINPVRQIVARAHGANIPVLLDGAQAAPHLRVDVQALDCDFYAFSGHKLYGPSGIGVLYGKAALLDAMPPYQSGGDMISTVAFDKTSYNRIPYKFEAGTPHIAGVVGLGAALDYVNAVGIEHITAHEQDLLAYATARLAEIARLRWVGTARRKACVLSFVLDGIHPHDVATVLDHEGVAVRAGHHCAQPLMQRFGLAGTVRASLALYNTREEIDVLARGLHRAVEVLG